MALCIFFFLWMRTGKGRIRLFPYIASLPLSPRNLKKPDTTHSLFIKKKMQQKLCHFGWHYASSSSFGCAQAREEEDCSPTSPLSISLLET
jgi:hypothetical protein